MFVGEILPTIWGLFLCRRLLEVRDVASQLAVGGKIPPDGIRGYSFSERQPHRVWPAALSALGELGLIGYSGRGKVGRLVRQP